MRLSALAALAVIAMTATDRASAASIFMKNGYIIQGPIVERAEDTLTLGFPNGRVYLAKRFISSVAYEPGEEKRLQEEERIRRELAAQGAASDLSMLAGADSVVELPSTLEELMRSYSPQDSLPMSGGSGLGPLGGATSLPDVPPSGGEPVSVDPSTGGDADPTGVAVVVPRPDEQLAERIPDPLRGVSLRPPKSWTVRTTPAALVLTGPPEADAFVPSMNLLVLSRGEMSAEEYIQQLKSDCAESLTDYELIRDGGRELGSKPAYEVVGRGTFRGKTAFVRQVLAMDKGQVWLLSCFTPDQDDAEGSFALTEEVLNTVQFVAP